MAYENILVEQVEGGVGIVTLNRPQVLNALSYDLTRELNQALAAFDANPEVRCIVITGSGEKAFSAGADIHEMANYSPEVMEARRQDRARWAWELATLKKPTIGALNGLAYGGASVLATSVDLRVGCERSRFRFLAAAYGRLNCTWTLPLVVGMPRAKELLYTARVVEPDEAAAIGLLNRLVPADQLRDTAVEMARQIAGNTPAIVQGIKRLLNDGLSLGWRERYEAELTAVTTELQAPPPSESFADFLQRKGPR